MGLLCYCETPDAHPKCQSALARQARRPANESYRQSTAMLGRGSALTQVQ